MVFAWDDWNLGHIAKHDIDPLEVEYVLEHARRPYPRSIAGDKVLVKGRTRHGRWLQVIYVRRYVDTMDPALIAPASRLEFLAGVPAVYVVHARDLRPHERQR